MSGIIRGCGLALLLAARVQAAAIEVVDDTGVRIDLSRPAQRIVSLAPGATEMLFAAGAGRQVIATVAYADQPAAARQVPRIGDSSAIDMERLLVLKPDIVVYWPGGNNPAQIAQLRRLGFILYGQQVNRLGDLSGSLRRLGALSGTTPAAQQRAGQIDAQLRGLREKFARRPALRTLLETWNQPLYTVGGQQLMSDALSICGAVNVFGELSQLSPAVQVEAVIARNPDLIIAAAPPGAGQEWLSAWKQFPTLKAVRTGRLLNFQDQALSRLGPSMLEATANLCTQIDALRDGR